VLPPRLINEDGLLLDDIRAASNIRGMAKTGQGLGWRLSQISKGRVCLNPIVAIVGRPNVGKSTLFNRLAQKRKSIVHSQAGITRDRVYETVVWSGRRFSLIDTGGFIPESGDQIERAIRLQVKLAIDEANLVLFMMDASEPLTTLSIGKSPI
jgi:tRNA U34 5-carboxymethylaminomethyl modifying GTPase MnmE/TrmE